MKILFIGNFNVDYSSESHYKKTFESMGHKVIAVQEGEDVDLTVADLTFGVDIVFWVHTHGWETPSIREILTIAKENKIPVVGYHLDLWMGIERQKDLQVDLYWKYLDYFFCTDKLMVDYLNKNTRIKSYYLPAGVYKRECYMGDPEDKYKYDVIFVGSRFYHPEWPYRGELINWLERTYGERFAQFGNGGKGTIRGDELNNLYASAKVVVGDTLCKGFDYPYYFSDRLFETTGRGGFLIFPYIKGIEDCFSTLPFYTDDKTEIVTYNFNEFDRLKTCIDYFIEHDKEREAIRDRGFLRTLKDHIYNNRLNFILETVKNGTN